MAAAWGSSTPAARQPFDSRVAQRHRVFSPCVSDKVKGVEKTMEKEALSVSQTRRPALGARPGGRGDARRREGVPPGQRMSRYAGARRRPPRT